MTSMKMDGWDEEGLKDLFGSTPDYIKLAVFLVDHSGSYEGTTIGSINSFLEELLSEIQTGCERICIMEIDENIKWQTDVPKELSEFTFERIKNGTYSHLGNAFSILAEKLRTGKWCPRGKKGIKAMFVLISDGLSTDKYQDGLNRLNAVPIFSTGVRITLNFSDLANPELLKSFSDNNSRNYSSKDKNQAAKEIKEFFKQ